MNKEIERKFIVNPSDPKVKEVLADKSYKLEIRYYLYRGNGIELRFTSVAPRDGETYYDFDRMQVVGESLAIRTKERIKITKEEFDELVNFAKLKNPSIKPIIRKSYLIAKDPQIEIKIYGGEFEGLIRVEVEFESEEASALYNPPSWFGKEITSSPVGNDVNLPDLSPVDFNRIIDNYLGKQK